MSAVNDNVAGLVEQHINEEEVIWVTRKDHPRIAFAFDVLAEEFKLNKRKDYVIPKVVLGVAPGMTLEEIEEIIEPFSDADLRAWMLMEGGPYAAYARKHGLTKVSEFFVAASAHVGMD